MDKFKDISVEDLTASAIEKREALDALFALPKPTKADLEKATALAAEIDEINTEVAERESAAEADLKAFADLKARFAAAPEGEEKAEASDEGTEEASEEEESEEGSEEGAEDTGSEGAEASGKVAAKGGKVATLAAKTSRPDKPQRSVGPVTLTASANVEGFTTGQNLADTLEVAKAVISRAKGFSPPTGDGTTENLQKFGTAQVHIDIPEELIVDKNSDVDEIMRLACDESRLPGNSLVAAGGWCAPSETVYDLDEDATTEGMVSLPEIGIRRGGLRWAESPTFADFYANPGFIQTEAQAIAGTTKPCIEVDCPDFDEARLDAEGICIKVPILTNVGYPEYVRNFVNGSLIGHQHWINANVIGRLVSNAGAARVITGLGATTTDTLEGLILLADQTRQKYRLSMNRTLEVIVPFWVRGAMRADLSRRNGLDLAETDAQIASRFKAAKLNVQFVYDWQSLDETAEVYPATFDALMYPAGTFVKGTADVINLSTVYDAASLATNTYTGLFVEQGLLVAKKKFHADLITLPICNAGRSGATDLTCTTGP